VLGLGDRGVARGVAPALALLLACTAVPGRVATASAQEATRSAHPDSAGAVNTAGAIVGAVTGWTGGLFLGAWVGGEIEMAYYPCHCEDPGLGGALLGAFVGTTLLTPVLTHVMGGRQGSLKADLLVTALASAGLVAMATTTDDSGAPLLVLPLAQVLSAILTERHTARRAR